MGLQQLFVYGLATAPIAAAAVRRS